MRLLVAPDKFKGSLTGQEIVDLVYSFFPQRSDSIELDHVLLSDGGDGMLDALRLTDSFVERTVQVFDPLGWRIEAQYLINEVRGLAIMEMSSASGIRLLLEEELDATRASTFGTGEMIMDAWNYGIRNIIIGIGGSATTDGGMGMATALGYQFLDNKGRVLIPSGANMLKVRDIVKPDVDFSDLHVQVACDVTNPLFGPTGAAYIFGPQKGASAAELELLDQGLRNLAIITERALDCQVSEVPGAGAAGGLGAGLVSFLGAELRSGVGLIFDVVNFKNKADQADWIVFAEGRVDSQSFMGKVLDGILRLKDRNTKLAVVCGSCDMKEEEWKSKGIDELQAIMDYARDEDDAMINARQYFILCLEKLVDEANLL